MQDDFPTSSPYEMIYLFFVCLQFHRRFGNMETQHNVRDLWSSLCVMWICGLASCILDVVIKTLSYNSCFTVFFFFILKISLYLSQKIFRNILLSIFIYHYSRVGFSAYLIFYVARNKMLKLVLMFILILCKMDQHWLLSVVNYQSVWEVNWKNYIPADYFLPFLHDVSFIYNFPPDLNL